MGVNDLGNRNQNLQDALLNSKMLADKGLRLGSFVCIYEDGFPMPSLPLKALKVKDVDETEPR